MAEFKKVAVLGAGVMGSGIAAHLAGAGIQVLLLDIVPPDGKGGRNAFSQGGKDKALKSKPAAFFTTRDADLITVGNLEDDLDKAGRCDLVIEVVKEDLAMDFAPSPTLQPLLEQIERFIREEVEPLEPRFVGGSFRALLPELQRLRTRVKELGLWLPQMPRDVGGLGLTLLEHGQVSERLGRSPLGHYLLNCQAPDAGNMEILHRHGTPAQHERWLHPLDRKSVV